MAAPSGLVFLLFLCCISAVVLADDIIVYDCSENVTTSNPQTLANIKSVLAELASNSDRGRFSKATAGEGNTAIYGVAQCVADKNSSDCASCVHDATQLMVTPPSGCAVNSTENRVWYERCMLTYSAQNFFGKFDPSINFHLYNVDSQPKVKLSIWKVKVGALMNNISSKAVVPANKGLGKGEIEASANVTIYGLVQCTGDLSPDTCSLCLKTGIGRFPKWCHGFRTTGCRIFYASCYIRFETYQFY